MLWSAGQQLWPDPLEKFLSKNSASNGSLILHASGILFVSCLTSRDNRYYLLLLSTVESTAV